MIIAICQARMNSSRLPGKVLLKLADKTVLEHVVERVSHSEYIQKVIVATTTNAEDKAIEDLCNKNYIAVFFGNELDVLDRYYQCAKKEGADIIVRITCDCPCIDPEIIDEVIEQHLREANDLTSNCISETYPDGLDTEVFNFSVLKEAWESAVKISDREHVTTYIKQCGKYKTGELLCEWNFNNKRWTLDEPEDYLFMKDIFNNVYTENNNFGMQDILEYIQKHPEIEMLNSSILRNEGYFKSLKGDDK